MDIRHLCTLLVLLAGVSSAAKVLLLPVDHKGHANLFGVTAKALQDKGHEVLVLAQERHKPILAKMDIPFILNPSTNESLSPTEDYAKILSVFMTSGLDNVFNNIKLLGSIVQCLLNYCYEVIGNKDIMEQLQNHNFDIVLVDGIDFARCLYIIPYSLGVPYITLTARHDPWVAKVPAMPSVEAQWGFNQYFDEPNFFQRMKSFFMYLALYTMSPPFVYKDAQITELAPHRPPTTYTDLFQGSEVFLISTDNYCMDYPRIEAPHYHFIGGAAPHPPKPLTKEFEDFVSKAEHGLIVVSFGSLVKTAPFDLMTTLMEVFRKFPQRVVMRYEGKWENVPDNVMLSKWLPQNDLIGHNKTVLYIAHGGNNGQTEGHYHGVPMVVLPFVGDQMYSAQRVEFKRRGKALNALDLEADELYETIIEVLTNPEYRNNIKRCSEIIKSFPSSHDVLDFWLNHVVKFGSRHLKPMNMDMPLYKYFMLDVLLVIILVTVALFCCLFKTCKGLKRCEVNRRKKTKAD